MSLPDPSTLHRVEQIQHQLELLDCVIRSEAQIVSNTENIPSTQVTTARQNTASSLVHITDTAMIFFERLIAEINTDKTGQTLHEHGPDTYAVICQRLVSDMELFERLYNLFTDDLTYTDLTEECLYDIFRQVTRLFLTTTANQMRRQFVRDQGISKQSALRKKIAERKTTECGITHTYIENDVTCGKRASHILLVAHISGHRSIPRTLTKPQMRTLCKAYGIATRASDNKRKTAHQLMVEIPKHRCMLSPEAYSRDMTVSDKHIRIPNNANCSYCQQRNTDDKQWLQCSICNRWYHRYCAEITDDAEWLRLQHPSVTFRCHLC